MKHTSNLTFSWGKRQGVGLHRAKNIKNSQMGMKINVGYHSETDYKGVRLDSFTVVCLENIISYQTF